MNELYLLSVCGNLNGVIIAAMVGLGLASVIFTCIWASFQFSSEYDYRGEDYKDRTDKCFKITKRLLISFACVSIFSVFIPSKRDMYMILGIGGTLDYLQSSETAKQLPEKCLKALDLWVTDMTKYSELNNSEDPN
jgi:hypothetical protein